MIKKFNPLLLIFASGLFLRLIFPLDLGFEFDQEQIAINAQKIISGKMTLIGPQTGPAQFFTGPLIYYVAAIWYAITRGHPLANAFVGASIYCFTFACLWLFLRRVMAKPAAMFFLSVYSLSAYFIYLDRINWNPNFSFLSAGLILAGLLFPVKRISNWAGFLGMWLAYQAHFSAFVMAVGAAIISIWLKRWRFLIVTMFGLLVSLLPTVLFDIRHDWINLKGLEAMMTDPEQVTGTVLIISRLFNQTLISLENVTKILVPMLPHWSLVGLGITVLFGWWFKKRGVFNRTQKLIICWWIVFFPLTMMFYRGSVPEYYFLMQLPAFVFIFTDLVIGLKSKRLAPIFLLILLLVAGGSVMDEEKKISAGKSLKNKLQALSFIKNQQQGKSVNLVYDMALKDRFGWNYLENYLHISVDANSEKTHLIYPLNSTALVSAKYGGIGVWRDNRDDIDAEEYFDSQQGILLYYPRNFWPISQVERYLYPGDRKISVFAFSPIKPGGTEAIKESILYVNLPKNSTNEYLISNESGPYQYVLQRWIKTNFLKNELMNRKTIMFVPSDRVLVFSFPQSYSWKEVELFLSNLEGI